MIQGIIFDWDGVLYDSFGYYYKFLKILAIKEGKKFPFKSLNDFRERMPQNFPEAVKILGIESNNPYKDYKALYVKHMDAHNILLFNKMKHLINKTASLKFGIASSGLQSIIEEVLEKNKMTPKFQSVIGYRNGAIKIKPAPDMLLICAKEMKIKPKNLIYVGDFYTDIMAARNAGMISIAVTWGYSAKEILKEEDPDFIAEKPDDIWKIVNKLNNGAAKHGN